MIKRAPIALCDCGMAQALDILGDRWSLLILREALYGVARFDDIQADINIPKSVLSQRLTRLVNHGILERRAYQEPGVRKRYEYIPTEAGRAFALPLLAILQWGDQFVRRQPGKLGLRDRSTGNSVFVGLIDQNGQAVEQDNVVYAFPDQEGETEQALD